ncbi:MAG: AAA family ATPase [Parcubacteria group bacterium]|nr:AAA family ATPase [Parcubacteria group bacterium]
MSGVDVNKLLEERKKLLRRIEELIKELREAHAYQLYVEKKDQQLKELREQLAKLREEVEKLLTPPNLDAVFLESENDKAWVAINGKRHLVAIDVVKVELKSLKKGDAVALNESLVIIGKAPQSLEGKVAVVKNILEDRRVIANQEGGTGEAIVLSLAAGLDIFIGDRVRYDESCSLVYEKMPKTDVKEYELEEVSNIHYNYIGGLDRQIKEIRDAIEMPMIHREIFKEFVSKLPKGVLLYGPPGCGKTLIAKALLHSMLEGLKKEHPEKDIKCFFLNIKGPELLNKYVGETERLIREIFKKAREKAQEGCIVMIFFDEMDALFPIRGSGISSDIEKTNVTQFLVEMDGLVDIQNVVVIGASNRYDLIDPAVLRPGRMDIKIEIPQPDRKGAEDIFKIHLTKPRIPPIAPKYLDKTHKLYKKEYDLFSDSAETVIFKKMIPEAIRHIFSDQWEFHNAKGEKETVSNELADAITAQGSEKIFFSYFLSGANIESIVAEAKRTAAIRHIESADKSEKGLMMLDIHRAIEKEAGKTIEFLRNISKDPNQTSKFTHAKSGERIVSIKIIENQKRKIENVSTGHYL